MGKKIPNKEETDAKKRANNDTKGLTYAVCILTLVATTFLLLFPSYSGIHIFAKGDFTYIESVGFIFIYLTTHLLILYLVLRGIVLLTVKNKAMRYFLFLITTGMSTLLLLFAISLVWIRFDVKGQCINAKRIYGGNCVDSLISLMNDGGKGFRARNYAIGALGQLADGRALPALKRLYTGNIPSREPLDKTISQYELKKAINWCEHGNITSWMYRGF